MIIWKRKKKLTKRLHRLQMVLLLNLMLLLLQIEINYKVLELVNHLNNKYSIKTKKFNF